MGSTTTTLVSVLRALGQEDWVDALGPSRSRFNPLDVLDARNSRAAATSDAPRVRRRRSRAR
jgi:hypothetical protein